MQSQFLHRRNPNSGRRDWRGAVEDAIILFFVTLFSNLAMYGYPPSIEVVYTSLITSALVFFISIQRRFKIEKEGSGG